MWEVGRGVLAALIPPFWVRSGTREQDLLPWFVRGRCYSWRQESRGERRLKSLGKI